MSAYRLKTFEDFREVADWSTQFLYQLTKSDNGYRVSITTTQYCLVDYQCGAKEMDSIIAWLRNKNAKETLGSMKQEEIFRPLYAS